MPKKKYSGFHGYRGKNKEYLETGRNPKKKHFPGKTHANRNRTG